jgi:hypothetical protein
MKTVQILGTAPNLHKTLPLLDKERWGCNSVGLFVKRWRPNPEPNPMLTYTRWFNMHSRGHMLRTYPDWYWWYGDAVAPKRIVLQEIQPDIPRSERFPKEDVMAYAGHAYFSHSAAWFMALAGYERAAGINDFGRVELSGFLLRRDHQYDHERPCFFYWVERLRREGVEVVLPDDLEVSEGGDPLSYTGPLYGYETTAP